MTDQPLPLPPIRPTIAWRAGEASVWQCSWCGLLAYVPNPPPRKVKLGQCPSCTEERWWRQNLPVGPFLEGD